MVDKEGEVLADRDDRGPRLASRPQSATVAVPLAKMTNEAAPARSGTALRPWSYQPVA